MFSMGHITLIKRELYRKNGMHTGFIGYKIPYIYSASEKMYQLVDSKSKLYQMASECDLVFYKKFCIDSSPF